MIDTSKLRNGMELYDADGRPLGRIEGIEGESVRVGGRTYRLDALERLDGDRVYLMRPAAAGAPRTARDEVVEADDHVRVPVREERLEVETRPVELGAVEIRKTVETEQRSVPVELAREEVRVEQRDVAARPATEADLAGAFQEGTIRVPVRGEEAVARKEAVVTGEVVIAKTRSTETQRVTDTIRKVRVDVDVDYERHRADYQRAYAGRQPQAGDLAYAEAEPHYRFGYGAGLEARRAGRSWEEAEADLRARYRDAGADDDAWERIKRAVREGFDRARGR